MKKRHTMSGSAAQLLAAATLACAVAGCVSYERQSTPAQPSDIIASLLGNWTSSTSGAATSSACTDIKWQITNQTGTSASGTFSATCTGDVRLNGTVNGTLGSNQVVNWTASGTGTAPVVGACPFTLNGTGTLEGESIRVNYSGTTCLGPISGSELLKR
ncbi:MAG: hypothetical protein U0Q12_05910 [Vicinamibacterales bacterium]